MILGRKKKFTWIKFFNSSIKEIYHEEISAQEKLDYQLDKSSKHTRHLKTEAKFF